MSLGRRGRRGRGLTVTGPGRSHWGQLTATDGEALRIWPPPGGQPARRAERVGAPNTGRQRKPGQPPHDEGLAGLRGGERLEKVCHFGGDVGDVVEQWVRRLSDRGRSHSSVEPSPETNVGLFRPRSRTLRSRRGERSSFSLRGKTAMEAINGNRRYDHPPGPRRAAVLENVRMAVACAPRCLIKSAPKTTRGPGAP